MRRILFFIAFVWACPLFTASSQNIDLYFADTLYVSPQQDFWVDVRASGFVDVPVFSFSLKYDSSRISYLEYQFSTFTNIAVNADADMLQAAWVSGTGLGQTLADSSILMKIHFRARENAPITTSVEWATFPLPVEFYHFDSTGISLLPVENTPQVIVIRNCNLQFTLADTVRYCPHDTVQITATCEGSEDILWSNGIQGASIRPDSAGLYFVSASTTQMCFATDSVRVLEIEAPQIKLPQDTMLCEGALLRVPFTAGVKYYWSDGSSEAALPVQNSGIYWVTAEKDGCAVSDTVLVEVEDCQKMFFYIPNVFSPDSGNENSTFGVFFADMSRIKKFEMHIYDRWGNVVFEATAPDVVWDGSARGSGTPTGVYVYWVRFVLENGEEVAQTGDVTLLR